MFALRRNLVLVLGLLALLSGAILSSVWLRHAASTNGSAEQQRLYVLAAANDIPAGALLRLEDVNWVAIDPGTRDKNAITRDETNLDSYEGALVRKEFRAGDKLTADSLLKSSDRTFLSAVLGPGFRALTLPVEAQQSSSGLVLPGDHVDIILTQNLGDAAPDAGHRVVAETVLHDVRVVAVEQALTPNPKPIAPGPIAAAAEVRTPKTITLEVSEGDAQKLLVAAQLGKVDLVERALVVGQAARFAVANTWAADVSPATSNFRSKAAPQAAASAARSSSASARQPIEVLHGSKLELR